MDEQSSEAILRRYLLGDLDDVERDKVEERLFSDDGVAEELAHAESDLIDDYALAVLSKRDRDLFEQNFVLTDERRRNLLFGQAVDAYLEQEISPLVESQRWPWQNEILTFLSTHKGWAVAGAAAVILLLLSVPIVLKWFAPNDQFAPKRAQREDAERRLKELNRATLSSQKLAGLDLLLQPSSLLRDGGGLQQIEITQDVSVLNLRLVLPSVQHSKYIVTAKNVEGQELFSVDDLSPEVNGTAASILVKLLTEFLPTNDYQFELKGVTPDGKTVNVGLYNLRVVNSARRT